MNHKQAHTSTKITQRQAPNSIKTFEPSPHPPQQKSNIKDQTKNKQQISALKEDDDEDYEDQVLQSKGKK